MESLDLFGKNSPLTKDEAVQVWGTASKRYTEQASGTVNIFSKNASVKSIFKTIEKPALKQNPQVNILIFKRKPRK